MTVISPGGSSSHTTTQEELDLIAKLQAMVGKDKPVKQSQEVEETHEPVKNTKEYIGLLPECFKLSNM